MPVLTGPPALWVSWSCRRCGHRGGVARTTIPVQGWSTEMYRALLDALRERLTRKHLEHGCIASREDFDVAPYLPGRDRDFFGRV